MKGITGLYLISKPKAWRYQGKRRGARRKAQLIDTWEPAVVRERGRKSWASSSSPNDS